MGYFRSINYLAIARYHTWLLGTEVLSLNNLAYAVHLGLRVRGRSTAAPLRIGGD